MKKTFTALFAGLATVACLGSCMIKKDFQDNEAKLSGWYLNNPKDTARDAYVRIDKNLHAFAAECSNNHTIRIYYNQAYPIDQSKDYKIVSGPRDPSTLGADEVYIEATTSATDTYISTGTDGRVFHYQFDIYPYPASCEDVLMQHYTSVPTNEAARLSGYFWIYPE